MSEEHYTELAVAEDDIAERIRTLDVAAPGTYKAFAELSAVKFVTDPFSSLYSTYYRRHNGRHP